MKKNDVIPMTADKIGAEMEGVCRHDGIAVFVPGLLPGEKADVRIVKAEKRFAFGRLESFPIICSQDRRKNDCPSFPRCGGCSARHMSYESTLAAKQNQVADCFQRIGKINIEVPFPIGMDHPFAYRNKTSLPAGGSSGNPFFGFYAPRSHAVIPAQSCLNAMPPSNEIVNAVLTWMKQFQIEPYHEETHTGLIRHLVIRVNRKGNSMVTVVANGKALPYTESLISSLKALNTVSIWLNENRSRTNVILSDCFHHIYGTETLADSLCGLNYELSPASFFQINPEQTEKLYQTALQFADLKKEDSLCDVYCGAGTITLMMARYCRVARGIEIVPAAVENAKTNAQNNQISNTTFYSGMAEILLPEMVRNGFRPDVIVVDPPRKGLDPAVIRAIAEALPEKVVYVSCNPATLARDAALFLDTGYKTEKVQPVDMFCWTSGVETVALLTRKQ